MRQRLAAGLAVVTVTAGLAAMVWTLAPMVSDPGQPEVRAAWPPEGAAIPATAPVPPPPPPFACPCFDEYYDFVEDEDVGSVEALPIVRLADAAGGRAAIGAGSTAPAQVSRLSQADTDRLLASLPPLPQDAAAPILDSTAAPGGELPPGDAERAMPLRGREETPPPTVAPAAPLTILRASPRGGVIVAPQLAALFSEPMAALGQAKPQIPPVRLSPNVPGEWRWLGSRLLVFSPAGRFPMATDFVARIPDGERALSGAVLADPFEWRFSTPPPSVVEHYPTTGPARRDVVFFVAFDQAIDPRAVLASIHLTAGGKARRLRLATEEEVSRDASLRRIARQTLAGRWLAFRATDLLPGNSRVRVLVGPGVPSREGPRRSTTREDWMLDTYGPLVVREAACDSWGLRKGCSPGVPWRIELSNPIDRGSFRGDQVSVEPAIEGMSVSARESFICIRGLPRPRTKYRVVVAPAVRDRFGGLLGRQASFTFETGDYAPVLLGPFLIAPASGYFVLDPAGGSHLTVHSAGLRQLRVQLRAVRPEQWKEFEGDRWDLGKLPGSVVAGWTEHPVSPDGGLVATKIDLHRGLHDGAGQLIVSVEGQTERESASRWPLDTFVAWVQVTKIGIDASWDGRRVLVRTTSLATGQPLAGVAVRAASGTTELRTNKDGVAELPMPTGKPLFVRARLGADEAFLAVPEAGAESVPLEGDLRIHMIDDRGLYRPGEEIHIKGWARRVAGYPVRQVLPAALDEVAYRLVDAADSEVAKGVARVNRYGSFEIVLAAPKGVAVGPASVEVRRPGSTGTPAGIHELRIEEFRRPEMEVKIEPDPSLHFADDAVRVAASVRAFNGSTIQGAEVRWRVSGQPADFTPPGWDGFSFTPEAIEPFPFRGTAMRRNETWTGLTDSFGLHALAITPVSQDPARPWLLDVTATAQDVDRQVVSASSSVLVHPGELYVGLRNERPFTSAGDPVALSVVVAGVDGKAVAGRDVRLSVFRLGENSWTGRKRTDAQMVGRHVTSGSGATAVRLKPLPPGAYRITASVMDEHGRPAEADEDVWVSGPVDVPARWFESDEPSPLRLKTDRKEYGPRDSVRLSVVAPFEGGDGLLTLRHAGVVSTQRFHVSGFTTTVSFALSPDWVPGIEAQVDIAGAGRLFASGRLFVPVPPKDRRLAVEVSPQDAAVSPGGRTLLRLAVADKDRVPLANAELTVVVVDEAVLAVLGHRFGDPLETFFAPVRPGVSTRSSRAAVRPGGLSAREAAIEAALFSAGGVLGGVAGGIEGGVPGGVAGSAPIALRTDMRPLALFAGSLITDGAGRAEIPVTLPESLTRFRVFVAAGDGTSRFGTAESSIATRLPLVVVPSPPRFLLPGDSAEVPVVVRNDTDAPLSVNVALRGTRAHLVAGAGRRLELPAHSRAEARFALVAEGDGDAQFQAIARAGDLADAAAFSIPIRTAIVRESAATYGEVGDRPVVQRIELPTHALPGSGTIEITTAATEFSALRDATLSLLAYPYECGEQVASRLLAVATLGETLATLGVEGIPDRTAQRDRTRRDLLRLRALQQPDGGFTFWGRGRSSPYLTVHVAHALAAARRTHTGLATPMIDRVLPYLRALDSKVAVEAGDVPDQVLRAQALYVRRLLGDGDLPQARRIVRKSALEQLPVEAAGWLLAALAGDGASVGEVTSLRTALEARVTETAGIAHVVTGYDEKDRRVLLATDERADAVVLEALLWAAPNSDLVPKLTAGLLSARRNGRWSTTQADVWAIVALDHAFRSREAAAPDFTARAWLGSRLVSTSAFRGMQNHSRTSVVPLADRGANSSEVTLARSGTGLLRYRLGLRYDIDWSRRPPEDRGLWVDRQYEALDDPHDVRQDAGGAWHIRAGARVRVRLALVAPVRRDHVALVSPLPAGLEPLNPSFRTTSSPDHVSDPGLWWWDREEIRDDRLQAFATRLDEGIWTFACEAVATTPGRFVAAPPRAEEMYSPEVFGRGNAEIVIVE